MCMTAELKLDASHQPVCCTGTAEGNDYQAELLRQQRGRGGSELLLEAEAQRQVLCVQYPDDEMDVVIFVPFLPMRLTLAMDLLMSFWVPRSLCMALGFMMTREQTAAGMPARLFVRTGRNFPPGKLELLQTEGVPAFHHWLPYTQGRNGQPGTIPTKRRGLK